MLDFFYTSATGAVQLQKGFDVTANNVANISTAGYKTTDPTFADLIDTNVQKFNIGNGARLQNTSTVFQKGNVSKTDGSFDFALNDPHTFFAVKSGAETDYTQNGRFQLSTENDGKYLVTSGGAYVLDPDGNRIRVESDDADLNIGVFSFANCDALVRKGDTDFTESEGSGNATAVAGQGYVRGSIEGSAVDLTQEMSSIVELQRAFQMNSKMIQIADEATESINKLG